MNSPHSPCTNCLSWMPHCDRRCEKYTAYREGRWIPPKPLTDEQIAEARKIMDETIIEFEIPWWKGADNG